MEVSNRPDRPGLCIVVPIANDALLVGIAELAKRSNSESEFTGRRQKLITGAGMVSLGLLLLPGPQAAARIKTTQRRLQVPTSTTESSSEV